MQVALATSPELPDLHHDDRRLLESLRAEGVDARPVVWDDVGTAWENVGVCVIRSVWDYAQRYEHFIDWVDHVASASIILNPAPLVRWNCNKSYLADVADRGVPIVPGKWFAAGTRVKLRSLMESEGWSNAVLKPAIAAAGYRLRLVTQETLKEGQRHADFLSSEGDFLVQKFLGDVVERGELSMIFVEGWFTHAVLKRSAPGEIKVHEEYGGTDVPVVPTADELAIARKAVAGLAEPALYARVDLLSDGERTYVSELEVIEPELFLRYSEEAVRRLTAGITGALEGRNTSSLAT